MRRSQLARQRRAAGLSQEELAYQLGVDRSTVVRWESGERTPQPWQRPNLATALGVSLAALDRLLAPELVPSRAGGDDFDSLLGVEDVSREADPLVEHSRQEWLRVRRAMQRDHTRLARLAAERYPMEARAGATGIVARPGWLLPHPIDLASVKLSFVADAAEPLLDGTGPETAHVRPLMAGGRRYARYSHAIRDIARPRLFENRLSWRLLDARFDDGRGELALGLMNYFEAIDVCEAVAHEFAAGAAGGELPLRDAIGDPFDFTRRPALMSINTLTIRRGRSSADVVLHRRDAANVATSGGVVGVMPAGVFQPSTVKAGDHADDFDLWRNIMREYSEEFLGNPEHGGDGPGADYSKEPLRSLDEARRAGHVRLYCLGLGVGALDLWAALETVAVFDAEVFDVLFAGLVRVNDEGGVLRAPFTRETIDDLIATSRLAPETELVLNTAWAHRDKLLADVR